MCFSHNPGDPRAPEVGLILVVEEEVLLCKMVTAMLKRKFGYEAVAACDGLEALAIFNERKEQIDAVLLDSDLPGAAGWETLAALRALRPDVPVILTGGCEEAYALRDSHQEKPQAYLHKPYRIDDLQAALKAALH